MTWILYCWLAVLTTESFQKLLNCAEHNEWRVARAQERRA